jgi:hypothetical protein
VGRDEFCGGVQTFRHRIVSDFRPKGAKGVVGSAAEQQIEGLAVNGHDFSNSASSYGADHPL